MTNGGGGGGGGGVPLQPSPSLGPLQSPATPSKLRRSTSSSGAGATLGVNGQPPPRKKMLSTITAMISADKERKKAERARQESKIGIVYDQDGEASIAPALYVDPIDLRTIDASKFDPWTHPATKEIMEVRGATRRAC
jgi:hypothetical protein